MTHQEYCQELQRLVDEIQGLIKEQQHSQRYFFVKDENGNEEFLDEQGNNMFPEGIEARIAIQNSLIEN